MAFFGCVLREYEEYLRSWNQIRDPSLLFQYGGKVGAGHFEGTQPTYVFPATIKEVVRARFPEEQDTVPKPDPEGSMVCSYNSIY